MSTDLTNDELIDLFSDFIREKGIGLQEGNTAAQTFFNGIALVNGGLIINRKEIIHPGDLLHEAGHIAVVSKAERNGLNGSVTENRPGTEGEEMAVMLWTYAACLELNIPAEIVFHKDGYKGSSEWIMQQYRSNSFIGLPLLVWMGMTKDSTGPGGFPKMQKWLRD